MARPRKSLAAPAAPAAEAASTTIQIDRSKFQIGDLMTFQRLSAIKDAPPEVQNAAMVEALPMFDRLVVGGIAHMPLSEIGTIIGQIAEAMKQAGNPGN